MILDITKGSDLLIYKMSSCIFYYKLHFGHPFCRLSSSLHLFWKEIVDGPIIHAHLHLGIPIEICKYICTQVFVWKWNLKTLSGCIIGSQKWERNSGMTLSPLHWAFVLLYTSVTSHWHWSLSVLFIWLPSYSLSITDCIFIYTEFLTEL